jgi:site-specific recombinase XerD
VPVAKVETAAAYAKAERAPGTRRAYQTDLAIFQAWCADRSASALPAEPATVAAFLGWEASRRTRPNTIDRRVAGAARRPIFLNEIK